MSVRNELAHAARAISVRCQQLPEAHRAGFDADGWAALCDRVEELAARGNTAEALAEIEQWRERTLSALPEPTGIGG